MFSTFKQRLILGVYILLILSIPVGAYLASQNQNVKSRTSEKGTKTITNSTPKTATPSAKETSFEPDSSSPTIATSFGATLGLKVNFEGRPKDNQSGSLFVGIVEGVISPNPKFLLSFTVDLPTSGEYSNLSLAGLSPGTRYSALLKGSAQIATGSAFIMSPTVTNLNGGQAIILLTGDLNEDNTINSSDYSIAQKALGSTSKSSNWNENADFNRDGSVNAFDLALITKNFGKIGDSGVWTSPIPKTATPSAGLNNPVGSGPSGYWLWVPGF